MNVNLIMITDIISGTVCLIMAVLLYFSRVSYLNRNLNFCRGRLMVELLLALVGVLTFVTGFGGELYYESLKAGLIQSVLPLSIFLFSWAVLYAVYATESLNRLMWRQLGLILFILTVSITYYGIYGGQVRSAFYYLMSFVNIILLLYYIYFFTRVMRKYKLRHPHAGMIFRRLIILEKVGLYGVCTLSVLIGFWPDKRVYAVYTLLYTVLFVVLVLLYHNCEVAWAVHSFSGKYRLNSPKETETEKNVPQSAHVNRQAVLNNDKIAEKVAMWIEKQGYRQVGITIKVLSKELGINRTYLSNFINEMYGTNFNGWINELRVKEAKKKMCESPELSLSEVADFVGFADSAHFSKQFKQNEGVSPSVWRRNRAHGKEK